MQAQFAPLRAIWRKRGFDLDLGIGIALGYATLGAIGFGSGRAKQVPTLQRKASFPRIFQYPFLDHIGDLQVIFAHHHHVNVARDAVQ